MVRGLQVLYNLVDRISVAITIRLFWRFDPGALLKAIRNFADTEKDTVWQLYRGFNSLDQPKLKAEIFIQMQEEVFHAERFNSLYATLANGPAAASSSEKNALYDDPKDAWKLLVYCMVGEAEAAARFQHVRENVQDPNVLSVLDAVICDESGHVQKARRLLHDAGIDGVAVSREFCAVFFRRRWEGSVRKSKFLINVVSELLLSAVYYVFGFLGQSISRRKLEQRLNHFHDDKLQNLTGA